MLLQSSLSFSFSVFQFTRNESAAFADLSVSYINIQIQNYLRAAVNLVILSVFDRHTYDTA